MHRKLKSLAHEAKMSGNTVYYMKLYVMSKL